MICARTAIKREPYFIYSKSVLLGLSGFLKTMSTTDVQNANAPTHVIMKKVPPSRIKLEKRRRNICNAKPQNTTGLYDLLRTLLVVFIYSYHILGNMLLFPGRLICCLCFWLFFLFRDLRSSDMEHMPPEYVSRTRISLSLM